MTGKELINALQAMTESQLNRFVCVRILDVIPESGQCLSRGAFVDNVEFSEANNMIYIEGNY